MIWSLYRRTARAQRRASRQRAADVDRYPRLDILETVRAAADGRTAACPEHGIQIIDDGQPRCGCPMGEMAHD